MADPTEQDIAANYAAIRSRVEKAAHKAGRDPARIRIVAVSKTKPAWMVDAARAAGATVFGENYVQEALAKQSVVKAAGIEWHLIGKLQSNKAKQVVGRFALLHAVDSEKLVRELDKRATGDVAALLEVNLAGEEAKAGIASHAVEPLLRATKDVKHVRFRGLMAMPPPQDGEKNRPFFRKLAALASALRESGALPMDAIELSMGTTSDFEAAIEEGATLVRIGTAIFGPRAYPAKEDG